MQKSKTNRGFDFWKFEDSYDKICSIKKSSLALEDCIWLGIEDVEPRIMAKDAPRFGINESDGTGWVDFPIPEEVLLTSRMHLNREQVERMLPILQKFVDTGEL